MVIVNKRYMGHINHGGGGKLDLEGKNQSHCVINHVRSLQICSSDINCFIMNILSCRRKVSNKGGKKEISTAA